MLLKMLRDLEYKKIILSMIINIKKKKLLRVTD